MMGNKKLQVWLPMIFAVVLIMGMLLGYKLGNKHGGDEFFASNKRGTMQEVVDLIRYKYVDSVKLDSLEDTAIEQLMSELDPHSIYLPPADLKEANEDIEGRFDGIGVEFNIFSDTINLVYVIPGGPGEKAGLQIGDKLIRVNDSLLAGKHLTVTQIKDFLRGDKGSSAQLQILRAGKLQVVTATRNTIPVAAVDAAYMIDKTTGYLHLEKFSENSYREFMVNMENLKKAGMQHLIFDLRGNGGGLMDEAVNMADEFLEGDKLVVYTEGFNDKKTEYRCKRPGVFETGKLMVLVDEMSASASEVLAASLQEWCRATVIGRRTFGKGLVQKSFPLSDGSALRLTIARYYTPLGRSIQRPYPKGRKVYLDDIRQRYLNGEFLFRDSNKVNIGKSFLTACKDTVFGGGGIMPNIFVPVDTVLYEEKLNALFAGNYLSSLVYNYYLQHRNLFEQYKTASDYTARFNANEIWNGDPKIIPVAMNEHEKQIVQERLKALLARYKWRMAGYYESINGNDNVMRTALNQINGVK